MQIQWSSQSPYISWQTCKRLLYGKHYILQHKPDQHSPVPRIRIAIPRCFHHFTHPRPRPHQLPRYLCQTLSVPPIPSPGAVTQPARHLVFLCWLSARHKSLFWARPTNSGTRGIYHRMCSTKPKSPDRFSPKQPLCKYRHCD